MSLKLCSACLLGVCCRYDGKSKPHQKVIALLKKDVLIPVCPEQLGGLSVPREPAEKKGARVIDRQGKDVTQSFTKGAQEVLRIARLFDVQQAILKQRSASCGHGQIYDGSFTGTLIPGDGVTTSYLKENGIEVFSEEELP